MGKNGGRQTLSKEMLEAIAEKAAEIAAAVATNTYQQKVKEEEKAKFDKRYKNTKLLLEHYRDFSDYGERAIYRIYISMKREFLVRGKVRKRNRIQVNQHAALPVLDRLHGIITGCRMELPI